MVKKLLFINFLALLLVPAAVFAQSKISGKVTDATTGEELPGANVYLLELKKGTSTSISGEYEISGVIPGSYTLVASYVGYKQSKQVVTLSSSDLVLDITLQPDFLGLEEVVVNALGFEKNRDQQGSASSNVTAERIATTGETSLLNGIGGKTSGVVVTRSSGDPGAGTYVQIRGQSTITSSVQPLIVVDGIPISNSTIGSGVDGVVQQSRLNDINPNDIESMEILKGASAAALWGSRAANGVIVIKTKKGVPVKDRPNVVFKSTMSFDQINAYPDLQSSYGQGSGGAYSPTSAFSWGDKIANRSGAADVLDMTGAYFVAEDGDIYRRILTKNSKDTFIDSNKDGVFQTGTFLENNLSVSGGDLGNSYYMSISDLNQKGVIKNNSDYRRTSFRFNSTRRFNEDFSVSSNAMYSKVNSNRIQMGSNTAGLYLGLLRTAPDFDQSDYKGSYYSSSTAAPVSNRHRSYRSYLGANASPVYNNPLWTINEQSNTTNVDRFLTSGEMQLDPTQWLGFTVRGGLDYYQDKRITYFPVNSSNPGLNGLLTDQTLSELQVNFDFISRLQKQVNEDLFASAIFGFNVNDRTFKNVGGSMQNFIIKNDGPLNFDNAQAADKTPFNSESQRRIAAAYTSINVNYQESIFAELTGRAETASTFGENSDKTFFYPAANLAWQFTQLDALKDNSILSFGKFRTSYGVVGIEPVPYATTTDFVSAAFGESWGPTLDAGYYANGGFALSSNQGNNAVEPEIKTEWEVGTDLRFFNDKLSVSATYYSNKTEGALFSVPVAPSTGFTSQYQNAADLENKGIELETGYEIMSSSDFNWSVNLNWTRNRNKITDLANTQSLFLAGFTGTSSRAVEGLPVGVLWGVDFAKDANGDYVLDSNGFPTAAAEEGVIGDPNPDWVGNISTTMSFKNLKLFVLVEHTQGGDFWDGTRGVLYYFGTHQDVSQERTYSTSLKDYNGNVIPANTPFRGNIQDFGSGPVALTQPWYTSMGGGFGPVSSQFIYDATITRLREVTLSYSLNSKAFRDFTKLRSVDIGVTGRNLLFWTKMNGVDPETNLTGPSNGRGLNYFNNPNTRSFLISVSVNY
ncbi:SusC/RagA family TonB-linked outer membrane protein [bacterium]|nr:MAG: SusC/RagA family TonB-linked outer membrane protein [bacterium]